MLDLYDAGEGWDQMLALARLAREPGWWRQYGLNDRGYVPLEASATLVKEFIPRRFPGCRGRPSTPVRCQAWR